MTQVAPICTGIGHFTVAGHPGVNRVRFGAKFRGKRLAPGSYRISARTLRGRSVRRVTIVVVKGVAPTRAALAAARSANTCTVSGTTRRSIGVSTGGELASATQVTRGSTPAEQPAAIGAPNASNSHSGVLAVTAEKAARVIRPILVAVLALSILLLAIASLPTPAVPDARLNYLLARHRIELAGIGAAALVGVAISFLIG